MIGFTCFRLMDNQLEFSLVLHQTKVRYFLENDMLFVGKQSEGHGYEIEEIWNRKQLWYEGT